MCCPLDGIIMMNGELDLVANARLNRHSDSRFKRRFCNCGIYVAENRMVVDLTRSRLA
jgi:hypothetical protein